MDTRRISVSIPHHIHDAFEELRLEMGLLPGAAVTLAMIAFIEARRGGRLGVSESAGLVVTRKRGRPRLPPPAMPSREAVCAALIEKGWLPAGATSYAWEATWPEGAMGPYVGGHPEVRCWGVNAGHGMSPDSRGLPISAGPSSAWLEVAGVQWRLPELIWGLERGSWPAARLEPLEGICHAHCHTCWRPEHYQVGASTEKFWRKKKEG